MGGGPWALLSRCRLLGNKLIELRVRKIVAYIIARTGMGRAQDDAKRMRYKGLSFFGIAFSYHSMR